MKRKLALIPAVLSLFIVPQAAYAPSSHRAFSLPEAARVLNLKTMEGILEDIENQKQNLIQRYEEIQKIKDDLANYRTNNFFEDSDEVLLARLLFGEVPWCSKIEKIAVAYTVINRAKEPGRYGQTLKEVILMPFQYSAFNEDRNQRLKRPLEYGAEEFFSLLHLSREILAGGYSDPAGGATHYINPNHPEIKGRIPEWTKHMAEIGRLKTGINSFSFHVFYREKL